MTVVVIFAQFILEKPKAVGVEVYLVCNSWKSIMGISKGFLRNSQSAVIPSIFSSFSPVWFPSCPSQNILLQSLRRVQLSYINPLQKTTSKPHKKWVKGDIRWGEETLGVVMLRICSMNELSSYPNSFRSSPRIFSGLANFPGCSSV